MPALDELLAVVARLRGPTGCPWDRDQTPSSMARFVLEEAHELAAVLDAPNPDAHAAREEVGDLLFVVALLCQMFEERGDFTLEHAAAGSARKQIERHPHVFAAPGAPAPAPTDWESRKAASRAPGTSRLSGVPQAMPALLRAERLGQKAASVGFDWPDASGPRAKVDEELAELDQAIAHGDADRIDHELGDVLLSLTSLSRHLSGSGSEAALRRANTRFVERFSSMESQAARAGRDLSGASSDQLEAWWDQAKREECP